MRFSPKAGWVFAAIGTAAVAAGAMVWMTMSPPPASAPSKAAAAPPPAPKPEEVPAPAAAVSPAPKVPTKIADFYDVAPKAGYEAAIAAMRMKPEDIASLRSLLQHDQVKIAWLEISGENGDVVRIAGIGLAQTVPLNRIPVKVALPYVANNPLVFSRDDASKSAKVVVHVHKGKVTINLGPLGDGKEIKLTTPPAPKPVAAEADAPAAK